MPIQTVALPPTRLPHEIKPFRSAERAWLWAASCLAARREGKYVPHDATKPCTPETILTCLDRLYRAGHIDMVDARILRHWGDRGHAPLVGGGGRSSDWQNWRYALTHLELVLRAKKIVVGDEIIPPPVPEFKRRANSKRWEKFFPKDRITFSFVFPSEPTPKSTEF